MGRLARASMSPYIIVGGILMIRMWEILFITASAIRWVTVIVFRQDCALRKIQANVFMTLMEAMSNLRMLVSFPMLW